MLFMPIIDEDHALQNYFPDRMYGVMVPTLAGYFLISIFFTLAGFILIGDAKF